MESEIPVTLANSKQSEQNHTEVFGDCHRLTLAATTHGVGLFFV
jgi:hypothetical protein